MRSNKKLGARTLLGAPGRTTRSILATSSGRNVHDILRLGGRSIAHNICKFLAPQPARQWREGVSSRSVHGFCQLKDPLRPLRLLVKFLTGSCLHPANSFHRDQGSAIHKRADGRHGGIPR